MEELNRQEKAVARSEVSYREGKSHPGDIGGKELENGWNIGSNLLETVGIVSMFCS